MYYPDIICGHYHLLFCTQILQHVQKTWERSPICVRIQRYRGTVKVLATAKAKPPAQCRSVTVGIPLVEGWGTDPHPGPSMPSASIHGPSMFLNPHPGPSMSSASLSKQHSKQAVSWHRSDASHQGPRGRLHRDKVLPLPISLT